MAVDRPRRVGGGRNSTSIKEKKFRFKVNECNRDIASIGKSQSARMQNTFVLSMVTVTCPGRRNGAKLIANAHIAINYVAIACAGLVRHFAWVGRRHR